MLSVIVPIKDEKASLFALHQHLREVLDTLEGEHEIIFVDDGSVDGSLHVLKKLAARDAEVKWIRFRRNYGQTAALHAGIDHSCGEIIVTLDGDLQNDPRDIPGLLEKLAEGYDIVLGARQKRQDHWLLRRLPSWLANQIIRRITPRSQCSSERGLHRFRFAIIPGAAAAANTGFRVRSVSLSIYLPWSSWTVSSHGQCTCLAA
jgi:glycosyltransferase involved in cell wall biosynthesis